MINELCKEAFDTAFNHGFWEDQNPLSPTIQLVKLALISSEIGEAVEAIRTGNHTNLQEELADICIRVFDLAGAIGLNLEYAITTKMQHNKLRPRKHGKLL